MANIEGYWGIYSDLAPEELEVMHVGNNGRMVHEFVISREPIRKVSIRVWFEHVINDDFQIRHKPGGNPWPLRLYTQNGRLVVEHTNGQKFEFERIWLDHVPESFQNTLKRACQRMDADEASTEDRDEVN